MANKKSRKQKTQEKENKELNKEDTIDVLTEREFSNGMYTLLKEYASQIDEYTRKYNDIVSIFEDIKTYQLMGYRIKYLYDNKDSQLYYEIHHKDDLGFKSNKYDKSKKNNE